MLYILVFVAMLGIVTMLIQLWFALSIDSDWKNHYIDWDGIKKSAKWLVIFIAIGLIGVLGYEWIYSLKYCQTVQTDEIKLLKWSDNNQYWEKNIYVTETKYLYFFHYQDNNKINVKGAVDIEDTTIYEEDCIPHIVEYTTYTKHPMNKILLVMLTFEDMESSKKTYKIYTPKGTVLHTHQH